jgi:hypothetical protein
MMRTTPFSGLLLLVLTGVAALGCSSSAASEPSSGDGALSQGETVSGQYLSHFASAQPSVTKIDEWDLDLVTTKDASYVVAIGYATSAGDAVGDGAGSSRQDVLEIVYETAKDGSTQLIVRSPTPDVPITVTAEQMQSIAADLRAMDASLTGAGSSSQTALGSVHIQGLGCNGPMLKSMLGLAATIVAGAVTGTICTGGEVLSLGTGTPVCIGAAAVTAVVGAYTFHSIKSTVTCQMLGG